MSRAKTQAPKGRNNPAQGNALGNAPPQDQSPEGAKEGGRIPIGDLTETRVEQTGPQAQQFTYVDIGSIDRETKRIVDPKVLPSSKAPSRAKQLLKTGDVLVSMTRPNLNAVAIVPPDLDGAIGSTGFHVLRARNAEPGFLFYAVQSTEFIDAMCLKVQGALYPAVRPRDISSFCIPFSSLEQQHRIVAEIEKQFTRLEAGVAALRRVQANLKRYRAAVLKAACEGRLVPTEAELARAEGRPFESGQQLLARILTERRQNWLAQRSLGKGGQGRGKYKEPASLSASGYEPETLPEGWAWASLDQLLQNITDGDHLPPPQTESGVPFMVIGDVRTGKINFTDTRFVSREYYEAIDDYRKPQRGDILFTLVGSYGIALRVDTDREFCIQRHIGIMRPHSLTPSAYLSHVLNSRFVFQQASNCATGTAQKTVPLSGLRQFAIPLPPLAEQTRIVAEVERRLSVVEELEAVVTTNLQRATRLRQSVLKAAFSPIE